MNHDKETSYNWADYSKIGVGVLIALMALFAMFSSPTSKVQLPVQLPVTAGQPSPFFGSYRLCHRLLWDRGRHRRWADYSTPPGVFLRLGKRAAGGDFAFYRIAKRGIRLLRICLAEEDRL